MRKYLFTTKGLVLSAMIAALYTALTLLLKPISYGMYQLRVAEAMTLLPFILPEAIPGLAIGCFLSNLLGSDFGILDMIFGTLATLIAAYLTYRSKHYLIAAAYPVLMNALIVGAVLTVPIMGVFTLRNYLLCALFIGAGEAVACYALGIPLLLLLKKLIPQFQKINK